MDQKTELETLIARWQEVLRLRDWDIRLLLVQTPWRKTGDIKIDLDDRKAVLMINAVNPKKENLEEVVIHELLHLKLYGMDQMIEQLIDSLHGADDADPKKEFAMTQFMVLLESTVEDLTKSCLQLGGTNKELSFGRLNRMVDEEIGNH